MDAMASLRPYQYRPLDSPPTIRILVLQPADDLSSSLKAQLVHVQGKHLLLGHGRPGFYEAVSYYWGEPTLSHVLCMNEDSKLGITRNADIVLRHLRSPRKPRYLWIDAICLN
ncbi:hypothetical protein CC78DRAFT_580488 [Lojkania enalia]|uniref:Heterokaryon incompatibility domain-containing protein n=1 Tax=Lojkania enalia TaxID=147567 RepID=A0A9P4N8D9_9PLEO|nr:hypothetical protein CC78DRAFT_580488 [Didymosphaeria enalia]